MQNGVGLHNESNQQTRDLAYVADPDFDIDAWYDE